MADLFGTNGNDTITPTAVSGGVRPGFFLAPRPGAGDDRLYGYGGNDWLDGGYGFDLIDGGTGTDTVSYAFYGGRVAVDLETGLVTFPGNSDRGDTLRAVENVETGNGADRIHADGAHNRISTGGGDDVVRAEGGDDTVFGGAGDDFLHGGDGDDGLDGGAGHDEMWGGKGEDIFVFAEVEHSATGRTDVLHGF